jgi:hypothetical protein
MPRKTISAAKSEAKRIRELRKGLNRTELNERLLNLHLLMEVLLILKKHFLVLMNHIHGLLVALANREKTLEELEESQPT